MKPLPDESDRDCVVFTHVDPVTFRRRTFELIDVYITAMRYPADLAGARCGALGGAQPPRRFRLRRRHRLRPGRILGLAYGYRGAPGQWWYSEVRRGVRPAGEAQLADFFELTELHVHPDSQGRGLGEALLRALAQDRPERRILLSTPEGENRAWRLYRRLGFTDVLRNYRFTGDPRPFGVLGRDLPLTPAPPSSS